MHPRRDELRILDVRLDPIDLATALRRIEGFLDASRACVIHLCNAGNLTLAARDPSYRRVLDAGDLNLPDGWSAVLAARLLGRPIRTRIAGPDFMDEVLGWGERAGLRHFFYGGTPATLQGLRAWLHRAHPDAVDAGGLSPPFRALTADEKDQTLRLIGDAAPDVIWVGLGTPKQDRWMAEVRDGLDHGVLVGVGAAFDFFSGHKRRAPRWMRDSGLEWFHRLATEPVRLSRRYLIGNPEFLARLGAQWISERRHDARTTSRCTGGGQPTGLNAALRDEGRER